jgi:anti-sigma regulatory factor (Ser/Thr protein kinase)
MCRPASDETDGALALKGLLPEPTTEVVELVFAGPDELCALRASVGAAAAVTILSPERRADVVFAVHELAVNVLRHGHGGGRVRIWREDGETVAEVSGPGTVVDPLIGHRRPATGALTGRGLWLVNQLCDLVQLRSSLVGTVVRVHVHTRSATSAPQMVDQPDR